MKIFPLLHLTIEIISKSEKFRLMVKIFLFILIFPFCCFSQTIKGFVFDENNQPALGVSIYFDGTTIGTTTANDGSFEITSKNVYTNLVISSIGYETIFITNLEEANNQKFYLKPKAESLLEVKIHKDFYSRKQKLKIFRTFFLGETTASKSCKILNEDDISLEYDYKNKQLNAYSEKPIQIENTYLDYTIFFDLHTFYASFYRKSIQKEDVTKTLFLGTTRFIDLNQNKKSKTNRNKVFFGSANHFFKNMIKNIWDDKNFVVFKKSFQANASNYFQIEKLDKNYKLTILDNDFANIKVNNKENFSSSFNAMFKKNKQSKITFQEKEFVLDDYGNISNPSAIIFQGEIGNYKVGNLLPIDFEPYDIQ
jgi:CarboxypepD_reg-like domain